MEDGLWLALGRPPLSAPLPHSRSCEWDGRRALLRAALRREGINARVSSPSGVFLALHGRPPPPGCRWQQLTGSACLADFSAATGQAATSMRLASWNVRWMVSPQSEQGSRKKLAILGRIRGNSVVCLQELHWSEQDASIWAGLFPACQVVSTAARPGPRGGPQGGERSSCPRPSKLPAAPSWFPAAVSPPK